MKRGMGIGIVAAAGLLGVSPVAAATPADILYGIGPTGVRWSVSVPQDSPDGQSAPLVGNGVAYLGGQGHTLAVRTSDGATLWSVPTGDGGYGRWLDGSVFVVQSLHHVTAYDQTTGAVRWQHTESASIVGNPVRTERDGLAYSTSSGHTTVLDLASGTVRWSAAGEGEDVLVADARTVLSTDPSHLDAFDAVSGKRLWRKKIQATAPLVTQGVVVDGDQKSGALSGYDERSGRVLWTQRGLAARAVAALGGRVLVQPAGEVALYDAHTGRQAWRQRSGAVDLGQFQSATAAGVVALLDGSGGQSHATGRSLRTGRVAWTSSVPATETDGGVDATLPAANFFATTVDDRGGAVVTDFATVTGTAAWTVSLPQQPVGQAQLDGADQVGAPAVVLTIPALTGTPA